MVVVAGLVPLLAACTQPLACTAIGCVSQVSVDVSSAAALAAPLPLSATLCVDGRCQTSSLTLGESGVPAVATAELPTMTASPTDPNVHVTLTLTSAGSTLVRARTTTALGKVAPNGEQCGPICWQSSLVLVGDQMVPAATPSPS